MAIFTREGYGQVEPNQLTAQKNGGIYASLPLDENVEVLQNGEFMFYDYASGKVTADGLEGSEPMLVFNEVKLYEDFYKTSYKDFAMIRVGDNYATSASSVSGGYGGGSTNTGATITPPHLEYPYRMAGIAPRMFKTTVGDIMTTNMVKADGVLEYEVGDILEPKKNATTNTLVLEKTGTAIPTKGMAWVVAKVYTMPDGQPGLKIQRVQ